MNETDSVGSADKSIREKELKLGLPTRDSERGALKPLTFTPCTLCSNTIRCTGKPIDPSEDGPAASVKNDFPNSTYCVLV